MIVKSAVVLFSGGTDSTCVAALVAKTHNQIHLLTFHERSTYTTKPPSFTTAQLRAGFPQVNFQQKLVSVDRLVRHFSYDKYLRYIWQHGGLVLATCGFSTLSWHLRAIVFCLDNSIFEVFDGLTRELMHFPGHMDSVIEVFKALYAEFGITYSSPVREWAVPVDQQFLDRVVVNTHGGEYFLDQPETILKTTGQYLYELKILPSPNVKGSRMDRMMQQDCYPFAVYNILTFWCYLPWISYQNYSLLMRNMFIDKARDARQLLEEYVKAKAASRLHSLLEDT